MYVFWMDQEYKLHSRLRVQLQDSLGMTDILSVLLLFHYFHSETTVTDCLAVRPGSAPGN